MNCIESSKSIVLPKVSFFFGILNECCFASFRWKSLKMNELFSWFSTLFHVLKNSAPKSRLAQLLKKWTKAFDLSETLSLKFVLRLLWARLILRTILAQVAPYVSKNGPVCLKNVTLVLWINCVGTGLWGTAKKVANAIREHV